jgi:hypothetical protein
MISYSTNWMGPINEDWIAKHGTGWSAGRIDIYGVPDEPWGYEYSLPPMRTEDWNDFGDWLDDLTTEELLSYNELIEQFETHRGKKIRWWKEDE